MTYKLTYENLLYLALGLVSIFIIYKLFKIYLSNNTECEPMKEGFQSIINKLINNKSKGKGHGKGKKTRKESKVSFDDLVSEAEDMDPSRYTVDSIKNNFFNYLESFQKAKFQNVSGTTDEALEKFGFFKEKFFDIFK
jgi:hypothetical protein